MKKILMIVTVIAVLCGAMVAVAMGATSDGSRATTKEKSTSLSERINNFDWSKTCPACNARNMR